MKYETYFLSPAREYLESIAEKELAAITTAIDIMSSGELLIPYTKQLRGPIRELISGHHRITYFIIKNSIYFVRGFRKKSNRTPQREIEYAQKIYKEVTKPQ